MTSHAIDLGFDGAILLRRLHFLLERAQARDLRVESALDEVQAGLHRACAATLRRDAATVALLLGDTQKAKTEFVRAGADYLSLGVFYGAFLLRLGDEDREFARDMTGWIDEALRHPGSLRDGEGKSRLYVRQAVHNPRQLLSLVQADVGTEAALSGLHGVARERLAVYPGLQLGSTGVTLGRYIGLLDELRQGELGGKGRETLTGIAIRRRELVEVGREDGFHWRRLHQPAEVVDFDLLALGLAAEAGGQSIADEALSILRERGTVVSLPFELARDLGAGRPLFDTHN